MLFVQLTNYIQSLRASWVWNISSWPIYNTNATWDIYLLPQQKIQR